MALASSIYLSPPPFSPVLGWSSASLHATPPPSRASSTRFAMTLLQRASAVCVLLDIDELAAGRRPQRRRIVSTEEYEVTRTLGEGGFGVVVQARHRDSGETVAVKALRESAGVKKPYAAAVDEILGEARFLLVCKGHPSLVALQAMALHPPTGELSLVMEYVGPSLHYVLHNGRGGTPFPEDEVRRIMRQILGGAKHMHAHRVIHRDIKPGNILVGDGGLDAVKICDLGLAMSLDDAPPYGRAGTSRYMAPEVLLGKPDYDALVDMWSLGCVMAELLGGKPLFDGADDSAVLLRIFDVLGVPGYRYWPAYDSLPLAGKIVTPPRIRHRNRLHEFFPEHRLSEEGFDVLKGLLTCNINKRLSATTALQLPWFADAVDAPASSSAGAAKIVQ